MSIFDLDRDVEIVKHRAETGLVKSKSLARSKSNSSSNNRLLALEQSLSPASSSQASLSSAYATPELTIFNQYYTLACGTPQQKSSKDQEIDLREVMRTRMLYLLPIYWKAYDPKAKAADLPSYNQVWRDVKNAFEGQKTDKNILYRKRLSEQVKVWEAFLWESREKLFQPGGAERNKLQEEFGKLVVDYQQKYKKKEFLPPPVFSFEEKEIKSLDQFYEAIDDQAVQGDGKIVDRITGAVFEEMHPASLGYAYLEWYDDEQMDPIIPPNVKKMFNALAAVASESTLTAPKNKITGKVEQEYNDAFKNIVDVLVKPYERNSNAITHEQAEKWTAKQKVALTKELFGLQAGLGSLHQLLMSGQEVDIGQLKKLALRLTSKAEIAGTGLDLLAIANASFDTFSGTTEARIFNLYNVDKGVGNYVTDSAWANSGFAPAVITVGGTIHKILTTDWDKQDLKSVAGKTFTSVLKVSRGATQAAMFIKDGNKASGIKPIMEGAKVSLEVAGVVTGSIGVILNAHAVYKELKEATTLKKISLRFEKTMNKNAWFKKYLEVEYHKFVSRHRVENKEYEAFDVILQKMHHRRSYSVVGFTGALAGIGAGATAIAIKIAAISAAVTLGNIWNPVGWIFAITSIAAGLGLLGWRR